MRKQFDIQLYNSNDPTSRTIAKKLFTLLGITLIDNPDIYGIDMLVSGSTQKIELEHSNKWSGINYPYRTVHVLERKLDKYFIRDTGNIVIFNLDYSRCICISNKTIRKYKDTLKEFKNRYCPEGELMADIPVEECIIMDVQTGKIINEKTLNHSSAKTGKIINN